MNRTRWNLPAKRTFFYILIFVFLRLEIAHANNPGGIVTSSTTPVTLKTVGTGAAVTGGTMGNGICQMAFTTNGAVVEQISYTYDNGGGKKTFDCLIPGYRGAPFYWGYGLGAGGTWTFNKVVDPATNGGTYAEIAFVKAGSNGDIQITYSMHKGSPGFYVTLTQKHGVGDIATGLGETRLNAWLVQNFNWCANGPTKQWLCSPNATSTPAYWSTAENSLITSGVQKGLYQDKYKSGEMFGTQRVWGWGAVNNPTDGVSAAPNVGIWYVLGSAESYNGGPMKMDLMNAPFQNMFTGGHYGSSDYNFAQDEVWNFVQGPFFVYLNSVPSTTTDPVQAGTALFADAQAQAAAEVSAWPYSWFNNPTYNSNYAQAAQRGIVTGTLSIVDANTPNPSLANHWVGVAQQPSSTKNPPPCDYQTWSKGYQFWTQTDATGKFTIPDVIAGSNYTLFAFGPGTLGVLMSQNLTGAAPGWSYVLPSTPFSVTVAGGSTTNLGNITWAPKRYDPTVFEIGYPDQTARKFRHGDDWWVGDMGPSPTQPSPVWTKFLEFPYDFPNGLTYTVGTSQWSTDWNFILPVLPDASGLCTESSASIAFNLPTAPASSGTASLYLGFSCSYYTACIVNVNGTNLGGVSGVTGIPSPVKTTGFSVPGFSANNSIREGVAGSAKDEWIRFPASLLKTGTNTITLTTRSQKYFADHLMWDYIRLELSGYVPPAPASVAAYAGNNCLLVSWPVTPGANGYHILRSTTSGTGYTTIATGVQGPVCGSGSTSATYVDTTAVNGTTYYYVVRSLNMAGTSANSPQSVGKAPSASAATTAPAAPTGVVASGSDHAVTLNWNASAGANYYTVLRSTLTDKIPIWSSTSTLSANNTILSTITRSNSVTTTTFTDTSVTNNTKYAYYVLASNAAGTSGKSTAVVAKPVSVAPSVPPADVTATSGPQKVTLTWTAVPDAIGYIVQAATVSGGPYSFVSSVSSLTYTDSGQADNTTYYYVISALNSGGVSANSAEVSATTPLAAPTGLVATSGNTQATLDWTPVAGATGYAIRRATVSGGPYTMIGTSPGASYTDRGLVNGTAYFYVVASSNANGTGSNSAQVSATPVPTVPVAPVGLTATPGAGQIVLNWTASPGATAYNVYQSPVTGGPYTLLSGSLAATTFSNTGLKGNTTFYYIVTAVNAGGESADSAEVNATTPIASSIMLTWDSSGTSPTNPANGSGIWNTSSALWSNGIADAAWSNDSGYSAVFGHGNGAAGTVTVGSISAGGLVFNAPESGTYTLSGGTLTLIGSTPTVSANVNASIGTVLSSTNPVTMNGSGTITLSAASTLSSGVNLQDISLNLNGPSFTAMLGTGTLSLNAATLVNVLGGNNGTSMFSNPVYVGAGNTGTIIFSSRTQWTASSVTGSGTLNLYMASNLAGSRDDLYTNFSSFTGHVNIIGTVTGSGVRYFLSNGGAAGSPNAVWDFGSTGTTITFLPQTNLTGNTMDLGALTGGTSATLGGGSAGKVTYSLGGIGIDTAFAGNITGNAAVTKVGTGTQTLSGSCNYTGATNVLEGTLKITGTLSGTPSLTIAGGAVLYLSGGSLSVSGPLTNNGTVKLSGTPALASTGIFINNGVLDLINSQSALPPNFINNGTVLDSSDVTVLQTAMEGSNFSLSIQSYLGHAYQLQRAESLTPANWANIEAPQAGTGSPLNFTDTGGATGSQMFYRVQVSP